MNLRAIPEYISYLNIFVSGILFFFSALYWNTNRTLAIWLFSLGIVFGLLVAFFYWRNHIWKSNNSTDSFVKHEFIKIGNRFKTTFAKTVELIDTSNFTWGPIQQIKSELPGLEKAIMEFQVNLPESRRDELREAWKDYRRKDDDEFALEYTVLDQDVKNKTLVEDKRQFIQCRIKKVLHFTDPQFVFGDNANV